MRTGELDGSGEEGLRERPETGEGEKSAGADYEEVDAPVVLWRFVRDLGRFDGCGRAHDGGRDVSGDTFFDTTQAERK